MNDFDWHSALHDWLAEPHKFGHLLGFEKLTPEHDRWINLFLKCPQGSRDVLMAHRNSYKTTCGLVALTLLFMIYPELRVLIVRKTDIFAAEVVLALQKIFTQNPVVRMYLIARWKCYSAQTREWSQDKTVFAFKRRVSVQPSLTAAGIGGSITGAHFDYIWLDDIVTKEDRYSGAERERTKAFVWETANVIEPTGSIMITGTPWHEDDFFSTLPKSMFEGRRFKIGDIHIPEITPEWMARKKQEMTPSLWAANYELEHIFSDDVIGAFEIDHTWDAPYCVAFIDSSFSNKKRTDSSSLSIVGLTKRGAEKVFIFTGCNFPKSIADADTQKGILTILAKFKPIDTCLESQLSDATEIFFTALKEAERRYTPHWRNNWTKKHESAAKHERITSHVASNKYRLRALAGTDAGYLAEIANYNKFAEHDDAPDSLAGAVELWQTSPSVAQYIRILGLAQKALQR